MTFLGHEISIPSYVPVTAWLRHGPFAMWLVRAARPKRIVELGSHYGYSYFAFCQAVKESGLETECFAVDTWEGDEHTGLCGEEVFEVVQVENAKYRGYSTLLRKTFAEALADIDDGSVDLLHIDGRHFYEDVKEDFESWIPKLAKRAIVLFHDTEVRERNFGVRRFWAELSKENATFNFPYQHGLGILFWGGDLSPRMAEFRQATEMDFGRDALIAIFQAYGETLAADHTQETLAKKAGSGRQSLVEFLNLLESDQILPESQIARLKPGSAALTKSLLQSMARNLEDERALADLDRAILATDELSCLLQEKEGELVRAKIQIGALGRDVDHLQNCLVDARRKPIKQLKRKWAYKLLRGLSKASPPLSSRAAARFGRSAAKRAPWRNDLAISGRQTNSNTDYQAWIKHYDNISDGDLREMHVRIQAFQVRPLISILMPTFNTPEKLLCEAIESVFAQAYENWELCIADDASTQPYVRATLKRYKQMDSRIKVTYREQNGHISLATNSAFELATGEWVALLDHDDLLQPHALAEVAIALNQYPDAGVIYSDEDKIDGKGQRFDPHFKPDFSPELFRSMNYLNHLTVHRADLVRKVGGWRPGFEGSQDYDINLRIIEQINQRDIIHIPKVLYHWRAVEGSTALAGSEKSYPYKAGFRALEEHLARTDARARVMEVPGVPFYRVQHELSHPPPLVSLIIPTRDRVDLLRVAVNSILEKTTYPNYEIIVMDNNSEKAETLAYFEEISRYHNARVIGFPHAFNFSAINNKAVRHAQGEIVGLINNDIEVITPDWLTEMVSWAQLDRIGCVGAKLMYPNELVQHGGVLLGVGGVANHAHRNKHRNDPSYFGRAVVLQNLSAVTAACLLVRKSVYQEVGGLDEQDLTVAFNDVDFCLKVRDAGYDNVWTPFAELYHHESPSRGTEDTPEKQARFAREVAVMQERWGDQLLADPYYSRNLTLDREDFSLAFPPRVAKPWKIRNKLWGRKRERT